ncbi:hypothetical protein ElyMa_005108400 [Elysia marginata]|uniref:Uncharacterized protein n=1 Tax=Elysia marginata TaxID=1093978 RepID=A0AAV4JL41_9GAST|nr:hypothetical protein ElyMa_005108400 [Elysia marginata]
MTSVASAKVGHHIWYISSPTGEWCCSASSHCRTLSPEFVSIGARVEPLAWPRGVHSPPPSSWASHPNRVTAAVYNDHHSNLLIPHPDTRHGHGILSLEMGLYQIIAEPIDAFTPQLVEPVSLDLLCLRARSSGNTRTPKLFPARTIVNIDFPATVNLHKDGSSGSDFRKLGFRSAVNATFITR